jgi:disulfide bond formation protein DsbB
MQVLTSVLALVAAAGAVGLVVARTTGVGVGVARLAARHAPELTLAVTGVATLGSLYFSEWAGYVPCRLCWFQRIAMYPIALIALVALIRRDRGARWYMVPLAVVGTGISVYHYLIEWGVLADTESCALFGPGCADIWFREFGFVTLAFMALCGFVAVIALNLIRFDDPPKEAS